MGWQAGARSARSHALSVLRIRGTALALALLPAAAAVILFTGEQTGSIGPAWQGVRWAVTAVALVVLAAAAGVGAVIVRARPAVAPTVALDERSAPDLYNLVRELAERLEVPAPSALALTPDCDSWLEDRTHRSHAADGGGGTGAESARGGSAGAALRGRPRPAPVLVIGSPFLWWMRVAELRALLAPVVAGTGPSAHPDIAAARRFVRGLDAAVAVADRPGGTRGVPGASLWRRGPRLALRFAGGCARLMLRACAPHAAEMERGVAAAAAHRAQGVDHALRTSAQEQVGLAYAGWDRLLTRVALPAWRIGRWPARLDAGVVSALTELSHRDSLAGGFTSRLGERPACDLLDSPGAVDESISLLAARLFHGGPAESGPAWSPVDWQEYPEEVVDRIWRTHAARLFAELDALDGPGASRADAARTGRADALPGPTLARVMERLTEGPSAGGDALAARIAATVAREDAESVGEGALVAPLIAAAGGTGAAPMGLPLQPPRSGREVMTEHLTAVVCCAAVDTAGAVAGLDWLDGPALFVGGERAADLSGPVLALVEEADVQPLRAWLARVGVRADKPVRLV
ncbi:hypothetical protein ACFPA8_17205 [Streptomyces ovatisporus]|uniref:Integral membrane protein n=1 Tax=Streptomyces ovatisporus TaxID=1128682 RepID=A0ABV9AC06_9ACTN